MSDAPPALPSVGTAFAEQVRVVGLAVRREALLLTIALCLIGLVVLLEDGRDGGVNGLPVPALAMIALGALAPFAVWKGERVFGGGHLWTLPVKRRRHALIKVLAGGLWLLAAVAVIQLWIFGVALASGGGLVDHDVRMLVGPGGGVTPVEWSTRPWEWAVPFTTAVTCYLIGSAFMLGVRYPLRWGTAAVAGFIGLGLLSEVGVTGGLAEALFDLVTEGPLGVDAATGGGEARETDELTGGRDVVGPEVLVLWYELPTFAGWAPAALAWMAAGAAALLVAASRHREG